MSAKEYPKKAPANLGSTLKKTIARNRLNSKKVAPEPELETVVPVEFKPKRASKHRPTIYPVELILRISQPDVDPRALNFEQQIEAFRAAAYFSINTLLSGLIVGSTIKPRPRTMKRTFNSIVVDSEIAVGPGKRK